MIILDAQPIETDLESPELVEALYKPWPHQLPAFNALMRDEVNRVVTVWHRRGGKDLTAFNALWIKAMRRRANYGYFFPFAKQGRAAIWNGITNDGISFREYIPAELVANEHDTDMRITLTNGSTIQFIGTDNIDSKMGYNFHGVVMSEYPLQNPLAWKLIEPILKLNGGWAWFPYTPRGKFNHGYTLYEAAKRLQGRGEPWFAQLLTIDDTELLTDADLEDVREQGTEEAIIQQEYYCDFNAENPSAYFAHDLEAAREAGRINSAVCWDPNKLVHTAWDFGVSDMTAIWFLQEGQYGSWHIIDYLEESGYGLNFYAKQLHERPYAYGTHLVPHDAQNRDWTSGINKVDAARELDIDFTIVPRSNKTDQIDAAHRMIPLCHFNNVEGGPGVAALNGYERQWDEANQVYKNTPKHNWASHGADAYMCFAMGYDMVYNDEDEVYQRHRAVGTFNARTLEPIGQDYDPEYYPTSSVA